MRFKPSKHSGKERTIGKADPKLLLGTLILLCVVFSFNSCDKTIRETSFSIHGYVTDADNQMPIIDAEMWSQDRVIAETDSNGYYRYTSWGGGVNVNITAKAEGYLPQHKQVYAPSGSCGSLDFALVKE